VHWLEIVITNAVVNAQVRQELPAILREQVEGVHEDLPLGIAAGDCA
jgi:hypothetical protein